MDAAGHHHSLLVQGEGECVSQVPFAVQRVPNPALAAIAARWLPMERIGGEDRGALLLHTTMCWLEQNHEGVLDGKVLHTSTFPVLSSPLKNTDGSGITQTLLKGGEKKGSDVSVALYCGAF